jgi:hypothetical protein
MSWVPCPCCENYWCLEHDRHAHDCPCPEVELWDRSPYAGDWYACHCCEHAHCPLWCEKPQPALVAGELLCMRCWVLFGVRSVMIPYTPASCPEDP